MGNESHTGANLAAMANWTRDRDSSRPIHYEGDAACEYVDVYSRMYASPSEVELIGKREEEQHPNVDAATDAKRRSMPFILCEYGHAMGNGPGGLSEYQELFERYPRCQGGFIWEWLDHGIRQHTADGREFFAYGGDFGEPIHDGNFRYRRAGLPQPYAVARLAGVQEGHRAGRDERRRRLSGDREPLRLRDHRSPDFPLDTGIRG
ncbi:glycoside hydrolase family 2 TIM barrel-domain containing protein [Fodinicola feengrottensis]|uniref:glycoside hydrolase family 2 TIM barrel-domain containing protein n=1 Tax=Fodinicola feengrottensis TaxID=435914 RepID=UPI002441DA2A|nr:glycoside hydrolase family 2 TIM barrel-domain containing protein [Fodinicola feengrottensis]